MGDPEDNDMFIDAAAISPEIAEFLAKHKPPEPPVSLATAMSRSKPSLGLSRWGSQVVIGRGPCVIDPITATASLVTVPGLDRVIAVAGDTVRYALGVHGRELRLVRELGDAWQPMALPPDAQLASERSITLRAHGDALAIDWGHGIRWWTGERWLATTSSAPVVLVSTRQLWLGNSAGEWGGTLEGLGVPADGSEPTHETWLRTELPVCALAWDADDALLVGACSLGPHHYDLYVGALAPDKTLRPRLVGGTLGALMALARSRGVPTEHEPEPEPASIIAQLTEAAARLPSFQPVWPHRRAALVSIDVGRDGALYVLTSSRGIFRVVGDELTALTPGWPDDLQVGGDLCVCGDIAVIASQGVLVCDLGSDAPPRLVPTP